MEKTGKGREDIGRNRGGVSCDGMARTGLRFKGSKRDKFFTLGTIIATVVVTKE